MKRAFQACTVAAIFCLTACQTGPAALSESDLASIETTKEVLVEAVNSGDNEQVAAVYAADAVFMPANAPAVEGRSNIKAFMEDYPQMSNFKLNHVEVEGMGDMAFVRGTYSFTVTPDGAKPMNDTGKFLEILQKQSDGSWLIYRDIFNSDMAVEH